MGKISRKIQADKGMTEGVSHFKTADWSKRFVCKFLFSLTSYSVKCCLMTVLSIFRVNPIVLSQFRKYTVPYPVFFFLFKVLFTYQIQHHTCTIKSEMFTCTEKFAIDSSLARAILELKQGLVASVPERKILHKPIYYMNVSCPKPCTPHLTPNGCRVNRVYCS